MLMSLIRVHDHRVRVSVEQEHKHSFPVSPSCPWQHTNGIAPVGEGCNTVNGRPVENYADVWLCMQESPCEIQGAYVRMVVFVFKPCHSREVPRESSAGVRHMFANRPAFLSPPIRHRPDVVAFSSLPSMPVREGLREKLAVDVYSEGLRLVCVPTALLPFLPQSVSSSR